MRERVRGTVKWFNATLGYGYITPEDGGKDVWVHFTQYLGRHDGPPLHQGWKVEFEIVQEGQRPEAHNVAKIPSKRDMRRWEASIRRHHRRW